MKKALFILLCFKISFSITLDKAINLALKQNKDLLYQDINYKIATIKKKELFGNFLPRLDINASINEGTTEKFVPPVNFVLRKGHFNMLQTSLSFPLFDMRLFRSYKIASKYEKMQEYMKVATKTYVKEKVQRAFINALIYKNLIKVAKKELDDYKKHLYDTQNLYDKGLVAYKDVLQTKVKLYQAKEFLTKTQGDYKIALQLLSNIIGTKVNKVDEPNILENPIKNKTLEELLNYAYPRRAILKYAKENIERAKEELSLAKDKFLPQVYASLSYNYSDAVPGIPYYTFLNSIGIRWNLFDGFKKFRNVEEKNLKVKQAILNYEKTKDNVKLQITKDYENLEVAKKDIELSKAELKDAKEHYKIAIEKYNVGLGTNTEVMDAEDYLAKAREDVVNSKYKYMLALLNLLEDIGYGQE